MLLLIAIDGFIFNFFHYYFNCNNYNLNDLYDIYIDIFSYPGNIMSSKSNNLYNFLVSYL